MNLQKRTLERLKKLLIEERWFNNTEFDNLFIHTYLNTKALVLGHKLSIVMLMDKRCDVLRISSSSIKETEEEIIKAELILKKKLGIDTPPPPPWKHRTYEWSESDGRPVPLDEDRAEVVEVASPDFVVTPPPDYGSATGGIRYRTFMDVMRSIGTVDGEDE